MVRGSEKETLNELLKSETEKLAQAVRYKRNELLRGYRTGHYSPNLTTTSGDVTLKVPRHFSRLSPTHAVRIYFLYYFIKNGRIITKDEQKKGDPI